MKLSQIAGAVSLSCLIIASSSYAETNIQSTAIIQATKKCADSSNANIDNSFIRAEVKASTKPAANAGGLVHLRFQLPLGSKTVDVDQMLRQVYWDIGVKMLTIRGGRWYSTYTTGAYFGRYLHGVKPAGSGSMGTNYNVVDGAMINAKMEQFNTEVTAAVLPQEYSVENLYVMILGQTSPIKSLTAKLGANLQVLTPGETDAAHILMFNASYKILADLNVFAEAATVNVLEAADNFWITGGVDIPTAKIMDMLRLEVEYKSDRFSSNTDANLAWMILLAKKVNGLAFYVNVGADPKELCSRSLGDVGGHLRIAANF
jgi:hypothetical protein